MKLSCLPVSYFRQIITGEMSVEDWLREGCDLGLNGIDLSILFFDDRSEARLTHLNRRIREAGLSLALVNTYSDFTHPDAARRVLEIEQLKRDIETSALLGTENVRIVAGQNYPETDVAHGISWVVEGFCEVIEMAEFCGVRLLYENHSHPGNWEYPDFSMNPQIFNQIASALKNTSVKLLFDTANPMVFGADPLLIIETMMDRVVAVHAADTIARGRLEPVVIGTGLVPFLEIFSYLKTAGFEGWISIEEASRTGREGVQTAVDFVRRTWDSA